MTDDTTTDDEPTDGPPDERPHPADAETIDPSEVELNDDRLWYDLGYKLGANEGRAERTPEVILGVIITAGVSLADPAYSLMVALILAAARWYEHRDWKHTADEERERHDPGDRYLWGGDGD